MKDQDTANVSASIVRVGPVTEEGGQCPVSWYDMAICVDGQDHYVRGWVVVGWLRPGGHADLDGSARLDHAGRLEWSRCASDGQLSGTPVAEYDGARLVVSVEAGDDVTIAVPGGDDGDDLARRINDAIEDAGLPYVPEPAPAEVYGDLRALDGLADLPVRHGDWCGCGPVLAWMTSRGEYEIAPHPDAGDAEYAGAKMDQAITAAITAAIDLARD